MIVQQLCMGKTCARLVYCLQGQRVGSWAWGPGLGRHTPTTNSQQPTTQHTTTTNDQQPTTNNQQPTTKTHHAPHTTFFPPPFSLHPSTTHTTHNNNNNTTTTVRMELAAAPFRSSYKSAGPETHDALRSQKTVNSREDAVCFELFDEYTAGVRPYRLYEVSARHKVQRHTVDQIFYVVFWLPTLVTSQWSFCRVLTSRCPSRLSSCPRSPSTPPRSARSSFEPQLAEQLVEMLVFIHSFNDWFRWEAYKQQVTSGWVASNGPWSLRWNLPPAQGCTEYWAWSTSLVSCSVGSCSSSRTRRSSTDSWKTQAETGTHRATLRRRPVVPQVQGAVVDVLDLQRQGPAILRRSEA